MNGPFFKKKKILGEKVFVNKMGNSETIKKNLTELTLFKKKIINFKDKRQIGLKYLSRTLQGEKRLLSIIQRVPVS